MRRADMHAEIRELRLQRVKLIRRCADYAASAAAHCLDAERQAHLRTKAEGEERRWISANILRPGEKL